MQSHHILCLSSVLQQVPAGQWKFGILGVELSQAGLHKSCYYLILIISHQPYRGQGPPLPDLCSTWHHAHLQISVPDTSYSHPILVISLKRVGGKK